MKVDISLSCCHNSYTEYGHVHKYMVSHPRPFQSHLKNTVYHILHIKSIQVCGQLSKVYDSEITKYISVLSQELWLAEVQ